MNVSNLFVCIMGMGVTFIGLICLIFLTVVMGKIVRSLGGPEPVVKTQPSVPAPPPAAAPEPNRQEIIAAVSAVLAEELGTDVTGIRILSFKKVS
ncbi:MAG: OadG family protein [Oscillospiraceae bacterium]|nr:OadG family protein [Oscillospiraceae bacterium]